MLTEVLHILIAYELQGHARDIARQTAACNILLVHDNAVGCSSSHKGDTIRDLGPLGIVVQCCVRDEITQDRKKQGQVAMASQWPSFLFDSTNYTGCIVPVTVD
jgi:hypothetical protein